MTLTFTEHERFARRTAGVAYVLTILAGLGLAYFVSDNYHAVLAVGFLVGGIGERLRMSVKL